MKKYKIYRNLHRNCFSVLKYNPEKKGYRLHEYITHGILHDVVAKVSEAGRQRVIKEKQKNVHAYLLCENYDKIDQFYFDSLDFHEISYNPYIHDSFVVGLTKTFTSATKVGLTIDSYTAKALLLEK